MGGCVSQSQERRRGRARVFAGLRRTACVHRRSTQKISLGRTTPQPVSRESPSRQRDECGGRVRDREKGDVRDRRRSSSLTRFWDDHDAPSAKEKTNGITVIATIGRRRIYSPITANRSCTLLCDPPSAKPTKEPSLLSFLSERAWLVCFRLTGSRGNLFGLSRSLSLTDQRGREGIRLGPECGVSWDGHGRPAGRRARPRKRVQADSTSDQLLVQSWQEEKST